MSSRCLPVRVIAGLVAALPVLAQAPAAPALEWIATERVGRLTACPTNPIAEVGLAGTDLGVSFEASGRLVFLFGDSWTLDKRDWDADSVAWAKPTALGRTGVPVLEWARREGGRFLALAPKGIELGGMNVPVEGFAVGDRTYVFFDGGWDRAQARHASSLLAHTRKLEFEALELDHVVPSDKFVNLSVVQDGADLWIFGSGHYRRSAVYLARVPVRDVAERAAWRYAPDFVAGESSARPVVEADCVGELSVRREPRSGLWLMAYNSSAPRGIVLRSARAPTGPWSAPLVIFDPERDRGYGHFMHRQDGAAGFDDGLSEPGREEQWGGEYGPYLVPSAFEEPAPGVHALVFVMSSWNPYQVHWMRTWVAEPGRDWKPPVRADARPASTKKLAHARFEGGSLEGWKSAGDAFQLAQRSDGEWELCTYVQPAGDGVRGRLSQEFTVPAGAEELRFLLRGGTESVRLTRAGEVLRESRGPRTNDADRLVRWQLAELRGQTLELEIVDDSSAPWGFVSVRGIELVP